MQVFAALLEKLGESEGASRAGLVNREGLVKVRYPTPLPLSSADSTVRFC